MSGDIARQTSGDGDLLCEVHGDEVWEIESGVGGIPMINKVKKLESNEKLQAC